MTPTPSRGRPDGGRPLALRLGPAAALLVHVGAAGAADAPTRWTLSGFGTLGYALLDEPGVGYRSGRAQDGATDDGSLEVDSRFGLQVDAELARRVTATVQGVVREGADGDPDAGLEWAFVRLLPNDSFTVRAGRMAMPTFAQSDARDIGYAHELLRLPEDVYAQVTLQHFDGADVVWSVEPGDTRWSLQAFGGRASADLYDGFDIDAQDLVGLNLTVENGPVKFRIGRTTTRFELSSPTLDGLRGGLLQAATAVPALAPLADDLAPGRVRANFDSLGLELDFDTWFADAEFTRRRLDSWLADVDGWYLSLGARLGAFTPYGFVSAFDEVEPDLRVALPPAPGLDALGAGIDALTAPRDQRTVGAGVRWDVAPRVALKAQLERIRSEATGVSLYREDGSPRTPTDDVTLVSAALNFFF